MPQSPSPRLILEALLPHLRVAASYARQIQTRIKAQPAKEGGNFFATALSDADLSVQTMIEVALLGLFPNIRFYGEEYEQTYNTKYFRSIELGDMGDYLVTLDPIDGTQFYLDGHPNYQIILGVLNSDEFEAAIALSPSQNTYFYALRGQGTWQGRLSDDLDRCYPLKLGAPAPAILLGWGMGAIAPHISDYYRVIDVAKDYSKEFCIPNVSSILTGELSGSIIRAGKFIDGAALGFLAQEAGCIVTTHTGEPLPPLYACSDYGRPGLVMATSEEVHHDLLMAIESTFVE